MIARVDDVAALECRGLSLVHRHQVRVEREDDLARAGGSCHRVDLAEHVLRAVACWLSATFPDAGTRRLLRRLA